MNRFLYFLSINDWSYCQFCGKQTAHDRDTGKCNTCGQ